MNASGMVGNFEVEEIHVSKFKPEIGVDMRHISPRAETIGAIHAELVNGVRLLGSSQWSIRRNVVGSEGAFRWGWRWR